ncbi:MAG TPA: DUF924 family protein [Usitatibacter sp.]|jgi:uncharacterized protein (DUF924 family)|nr:DUF924 family protein [Usitatibacter sp.]
MSLAPGGPSFEAVLDFWFGPLDRRGPARREWFVKDPAFDAEIARRFGDLHRAASARRLEAWRMSALPMLALVVVLDQFSRNLYRGDARAFAQDAHARECAREALERGDDLTRLPVERQFLYLPFVHGEDPVDQDRGVELMGNLEAFPETRGVREWAVKHRDIVRRFGRFPHRNAALGRPSTPAELEFLAQPGSGF